MTPREMFVWLLICAIQDDVLTLSDCLTIFKTCMTILKILGGPSSPSSLTTLLELYRASYAVWRRSKKHENRSDPAQPPFSVRLPPANLEIIVLSNPAPVQQPRPFSILVHHHHRRFIHVHLSSILEILKALNDFALERMWMEFQHEALVSKTIIDCIFTLQNLLDYLDLAPPTYTVQQEPDFKTPAPGTPPLTNW